jgi:hypothetical protein
LLKNCDIGLWSNIVTRASIELVFWLLSRYMRRMSRQVCNKLSFH